MKSFYTSVIKYGSNILYRGYEDGKPVSKKIKFEPTLYVPTKEKTEIMSLVGNKYLKPKKFDSMNAANDFIEQYKDVHGFDIFGTGQLVTQFIQEKFPGKIEFDASLINVFAYDIETDSDGGYANIDEADKEIISISMRYAKSKEYILLALKGYDKSKTITGIDPENIRFEEFANEKLMLNRFIQIWTNSYPDVVTGWNVEYYDIMYTVTRIIRLFGEEKAKQLSPWGNIRKKTNEFHGRQQSTYEIYGVSVIDYMDAFKKFGYKYGPQESFKLDNIAGVILGEKKVDYSEYGNLNDLYKKNPQLFLDYSLKDTYLIQRFEEETALLQLVFTVAYGGGVNYSDAFGTVGIWESTIYRELVANNVIPFIKRIDNDSFESLIGGYVKDVKPGLYDWIVSLDLNSLYPHLMMQYNMSPETYVHGEKQSVSVDMVLANEYQNETEYAVAANGAMFRKNFKGVIPRIIEGYYAERKAVKIEMLEAESRLESIKKEMEKRKLKI